MSSKPSVKQKIKSLLNEADIYKTQGLLEEGLEKYMTAAALMQKYAARIANHEKLLAGLKQKIIALKEEIRRVEDAPLNQEMPENVLNIIKENFAFSKDEGRKGMDQAISLAKFGQFESALAAFRALLDKEDLRLEAAKNLIRCHIALGTLEDAARQYEQWADTRFFPPPNLEQIRGLLGKAIEKRGMDIPLSEPEGEETSSFTEEEILDISSVAITLTDGPGSGQSQEFDVSFQAGSILNLLISGKDRAFLKSIQVGGLLDIVQFYSPIAMFDGKAVVVNKSEITSGPKQGHFSLDIRIKSI